MAFNPFNVFRRNQRAIFAVITVFIMFTFVLSSGLGGGADFFDWFPRWFGGKANRGDHLATVDGDKVYVQDLEKLRYQRVLANKFLGYAADEVSNTINQAAFDLQSQATPRLMQTIQQSAMFGGPGAFEKETQRIIDDPKGKAADKSLVQNMRAQVGLFQARARFQQTGSYLGDVPNRGTRNLIDFVVWEREAKKLGIEFTGDDVGALLDREFMGLFKDDRQVRARLQAEMPNFNLENCRRALAAEFRVRAAFLARTGLAADRSDRTRTAPPIFTTPDDVFEFYRDKTGGTDFQVLAVPAASFTALLPAAPTEDELQRLFADRKDYEPDPAKEDPGFKQPRMVKVEWVSATGEEPYYRAKAKEWAARAEQAAKGEVWGLTVPLAGFGPAAWPAMTLAPAAVKEPLVYDAYQQRADGHRFAVFSKWEQPALGSVFSPLGGVLETSVVRPPNVAALLGGGAAAAAGGGAFPPGTLLAGAAVAAEQRARVRAGVGPLFALLPGPGLLATSAAGEAAYRKLQPEALPVEAYKPELLKELTEKKARALAVADLQKLQEDVRKASEDGKAKSKDEAKGLVAEFVKTRGVKTGASADWQTEWTIADDPGLAPLKAVKDKGADGADPHAALGGAIPPVVFGKKFFYTTERGSRQDQLGTYRPEFYPDKAAENALSPFGPAATAPVFLAWRTAEEPAKPMTFQAAKPRVVEAWKRVKARELAKAEAERVAADLRASPGDSPHQFVPRLYDLRASIAAKLADPKDKDRLNLFTLRNVAPIQIAPGARGMSTARPFQLAASADLPYPTADMAKALLEERTKPPKTAVVLPDQPKDTYYVFVVEKRNDPAPSEFQEHMYGLMASLGGMPGMGGGGVRDQIRQAYDSDAETRTRESVLGLVKKDLGYTETDEQKKKIDDRDKKGGGDE